jgi:hypothetical protein
MPFGEESPVLITVVAPPPAIGKRTTRWPSESVANTWAPSSATPKNSAPLRVPITLSAPLDRTSFLIESVVSARTPSGSAK